MKLDKLRTMSDDKIKRACIIHLEHMRKLHNEHRTKELVYHKLSIVADACARIGVDRKVIGGSY